MRWDGQTSGGWPPGRWPTSCSSPAILPATSRPHATSERSSRAARSSTMDESRLSIDELRAHWHLDLVLAFVRGKLRSPLSDDPHEVLHCARDHGLDLIP